jgi:MFS family permease
MNLSRRFIVVSIITIAAAQLFGSALSISYFEKVYRKTVISQFEVLAQNLKENIESGLKKYKSYDNYVGIDSVLESALGKKPKGVIDSILASSSKGRLLYLWSEGKGEAGFRKLGRSDGLFLKDGAFEDYSAQDSRTVRHRTEAGAHIVSAPIVHHDQWLGNISIVFSGEIISDKIWIIVYRTLTLLGALLTLSLALLALGSRFVSKARHEAPGNLGVDRPLADRRRQDKKVRHRLMAVFVTVLLIGQALFAFFSLRGFRAEYLEAITENTNLAAVILREDVERLIAKGLPLGKLVGIEMVMANIVRRTPEYSSLEILDPDGSVLYLADPGMEQFRSFKQGDRMGSIDETDSYNPIFPIKSKTDAILGYIKVSIDRSLIDSRMLSLLLDYLAIVVIATLVSFEMIMFFMSGRFDGKRDQNDRDGPAWSVSGAQVRTLGFLAMFSSFLFMPFFSIFMKELSRPMLGLSKDFITGLPISVYMFSASVGFILKGVIHDRFGYRAAFLAGAVVFAAGLVLTGLSREMAQVILAQVLSGIGFGIIYLIPQSLIMDNTEPQERAAALSGLFAGFYAGIICGSSTGGMLAERLGYQAVFLLSAGVVLLTYLFARFNVLKHEKRPVKEKSVRSAQEVEKVSVMDLLKDKSFMAPLLTQGILYQFVYVGFLFFLLPLFLKSQGFNESDIGRIVMVHGLVIIAGPFIIRFASRWLSQKVQIVMAGVCISLLLMGAYLLFGVLGVTPGPLSVVPWIVLIAVCNCIQSSGIVPVSMNSTIAQKVGATKALSAYRLVERTGNVSAPILCSLLLGFFSAHGVDALSFEIAIAAIGAVFLVGTFLFALLVEKGVSAK